MSVLRELEQGWRAQQPGLQHLLPGHFPGTGQFCLEQIGGQEFSAEIREPAGISSVLTATPQGPVSKPGESRAWSRCGAGF